MIQPGKKTRSEQLLDELETEGQPRASDKNPDNAWRLRNYCRMYTLEAIEKVACIMRGNDPKLSLTAASMILDRGWGKPVQQMEVGQPGDFAELSDKQLDEFINLTSKQIEAGNQLQKMRAN